MTSFRLAGFVALALLCAPAAVSAAQVEHDEDRQVDAARAQGNVSAVFLQEDAASDDATFQVDAAFMAALIPTESGLAQVLAFIFGLQLPAEPPLAPPEPVAVVSQEPEALFQEGVSAAGAAHASEGKVTTQASMHAGSYGASGSAGARPVDTMEAVVPVEQHEPRESPPAEEAPSETAADEPSFEEPAALAASTGSVNVEPIALPVVLAASVAVLGTSAGTALAAVPGWRTAILRLLKRFGWMALFSRIAQEDILNHERRSELLEYVRHNPGERVEVARRALGFSNGSMHYHLRVLQDRNLVKILKEGSRARLYPRGPKITPAPYVPAQRKRFVDALMAAPGTTQRELAAALGLSERMVSYHVRALAQQGLVEVRPEGSRKRLFPAQAASSQGMLVPAS